MLVCSSSVNISCLYAAPLSIYHACLLVQGPNPAMRMSMQRAEFVLVSSAGIIRRVLLIIVVAVVGGTALFFLGLKFAFPEYR